MAATAGGRAGTQRLQAATRYAKVRPVCPPPAPGRATCLALLRAPVAASAAAAAGAKPYALNDGATASGPAGGLTPAQLAGAYGYDPTAGGAGQTVAIVDAFDDPKIEADLGEFDKKYGLGGLHDRERLLQEGRAERKHGVAAGSRPKGLVGRDLARRGGRALGL